MKIIYIVGNGRSGSTLLDIILGNCREVESVGELCNVVRSGWINNEYCACGKLTNTCEYWTKVQKRWLELSDITDIKEYLLLQNKFERLRGLLKFKLGLCDHKDFQRYLLLTKTLFQAISSTTGNSAIVDSSKGAPRAYYLTLISDFDLRLIHLIRDGRGVSYSLAKSWKKNAAQGIQHDLPSRPVFRTALAWTLSNTLSEWVMSHLKRENKIRVRYEDLINNPVMILTDICTMANINATDILQAVRSGEAMGVGHNIAGNRLRMSKKIVLKKDETWKTELSSKSKSIFWLTAGWLLRRYDYKK